MAKPRIFVSSTYYDLKHIRSSLELFIESIGYEPVLSEKGDIAYMPDSALDESCYREAAAADIFVLVIGGRYGSEVSGGKGKPTKEFFERYDSITRREFESAYASDIPIYILIDNGVHSEYQTYLKNRDNKGVIYAHVDSVNVFRLIEEILSKPRNNPVYGFERSAQIEIWLREQWAGQFRELLKNRSQQRQLAALTDQIVELKTVNETLKKYLEAVMTGASKNDSSKLIVTEERRLEASRRGKLISENGWHSYLKNILGIDDESSINLIVDSTSLPDFKRRIRALDSASDRKKAIIETLAEAEQARNDFNDARLRLGLEALNLEPPTRRMTVRTPPKKSLETLKVE